MSTKSITSKSETKPKSTTLKGQYFYSIGRRKTAVARIRLYKNGKGIFEINGKDVKIFSQTKQIEQLITKPLLQTGHLAGVDITGLVSGGGIKSQAEAISLAISRSLLLLNPDLRKSLKPLGLLKRDPRKKERKKPGLKRARRAPQWAKR